MILYIADGSFLMSYWIYYWTANGPVIFLISSTYQFHRLAALVPILFLRKVPCIINDIIKLNLNWMNLIIIRIDWIYE
jgi:hypothetical protein